MAGPRISKPRDDGRRDFLNGAASTALIGLLASCGNEGQSESRGAPPTTGDVPPAPNPSPAPPAAGPVQPVPTGAIVPATLTTSGTAGSEISEGFVGISYEKAALSQGQFTASNGAMIAIFKLLGPSLLRIGGKLVDTTVWNPAGKGGIDGETAPADIDNLAGFLKATGWRVLYGVNLGGAHDGSTSLDKASDEVAYAAKKLGASLAGIEIGNEPDHYTDAAAYYPPSWTIKDYLALWDSFRSAIVGRTPGVAVTGPSIATTAWLQGFATATKGNIAELTCHYYRGAGNAATASIDDLLSNDASAPTRLSKLATAAAISGTPFRVTECNSYFFGGKRGVSDTYASALWAIQFLAACAAQGAAGANFHCGNSSAYSPILERRGLVKGVAPEFYGLLLFSKLGVGSVLNTRIDGAGATSAAISVSRADGTYAALVANPNLAASLDVTVRMPALIKSATALEMRQGDRAAPSDLAAVSDVSIQNSSIDASGTIALGAAYALTVVNGVARAFVPAGSAVLIEMR